VYDHPANVFVAGFIGSPPMNLLRGRAAQGSVSVGDVTIDGLKAPDGDVVVGIRPEGLRPVGEDLPGPVVEVAVEVIEPLGDEVLVHGSIGAGAVDARADDAEVALLSDPGGERAPIVLRLPSEERPAVESRLRVAIAPAKVRLFDVATGAAIRPT
jgi:multiple sugar transport system ATP-binding protein